MIYEQDIEKKCALCQKSKPIVGSLDMVCEKYGVVAYDHVCKKYKYDIFKKKLKRKNRIEGEYTEEDFSID